MPDWSPSPQDGYVEHLENELVKARRRHWCDERCSCPRCRKPLYYSPHYDDHACIDPVCRWHESVDGRLIGARISIETRR